MDNVLDGGKQEYAEFGKPFGRPFAPAHNGVTRAGEQLTRGETPSVKPKAESDLSSNAGCLVAGAPCGLPIASDE